MTEPSEESSAAPETTDEIKFSDLTPKQQNAAIYILEAFQPVLSWGRMSGKSFLIKYLIQEFNKREKQ